MQLVEIAEMHRSLGVFQEWSVLKNNQRLDFFVLLYQDKRTKIRKSDFYRTIVKDPFFDNSKSFSASLIFNKND